MGIFHKIFGEKRYPIMDQPDEIILMIRLLKEKFDDEFHDMRLRVVNSRPCQVQILNGKPGSWPYGVLFFILDPENMQLSAMFGDLTVPVSGIESFILYDIATNPESQFAWQW